MVWTMVALPSGQRAKSHYSLIKGRTKVWTRVALRGWSEGKLHYSLTIGRTKSGQWSHYGLIRGQSRTIVWSWVARKSGQWSHYGLISDQSLDKSCPKIWPQIINWPYLFDCSFHHCFWPPKKVAGNSKWLSVYIFINQFCPNLNKIY